MYKFWLRQPTRVSWNRHIQKISTLFQENMIIVITDVVFVVVIVIAVVVISMFIASISVAL